LEQVIMNPKPTALVADGVIQDELGRLFLSVMPGVE
jgi:hypothetical protein